MAAKRQSITTARLLAMFFSASGLAPMAAAQGRPDRSNRRHTRWNAVAGDLRRGG